MQHPPGATRTATSSVPETTLTSRSNQWQVLWASWLGQMFDGMDASLFVLVLFPAVSELVQSNSHSVVGIYGSYILATFMIGWAVGAIAFGIATDYIGRTKTMVITVLLYALSTGLCAFSHNWVELAFFRFLVGAGIGGEIIVGAVLMAESWQGKARLHATSFMTSSFGFGYLLAAGLNLVLGQWGWRLMFLAGSLPALLAIYIRCQLKEPLQFQFAQEHKRRLKSKTKELLTAEEQSLVQPTFPQLFNRENLHKVLVVTVLASTAIIGYWAVLSWIPPWINQMIGTQAITQRSLAAACMNIGAILSACLAGTFITWAGSKRTLAWSFLLALLSCMGMFLTVKTYGPELLGWCFAVGFFAVLPFTVLFIHVPTLFVTRLRGTAFGFSVQVGRIFAAAAAIISGQLITLFAGSYAMAGACLSSIYIIGFVSAFFLPQASKKSSSISCVLESP